MQYTHGELNVTADEYRRAQQLSKLTDTQVGDDAYQVVRYWNGHMHIRDAVVRALQLIRSE